MFLIVKKHHILYAALAVVGVVTLAIVLLSGGKPEQKTVPTAASTDSWGLSFQTPGAAPVGNANAAYLAKYNAVFTGDVTQKRIYLTFDAGYENGNMPSILDTLKKHNVQATFFIVGHFAESQPDLLRRMVSEGHIIGNHTYSHPDMGQISTKESFSQQLTRLEELYTEITGEALSKFYRPPQGKYSEQNLQYAKELGYTTVFWSLAHVDWYENDQPDPQTSINKLCERIHPGAIVLLHSTSATNAQILDELLTRWESMGYSFGSLQELVKS